MRCLVLEVEAFQTRRTGLPGAYAKHPRKPRMGLTSTCQALQSARACQLIDPMRFERARLRGHILLALRDFQLRPHADEDAIATGTAHQQPWPKDVIHISPVATPVAGAETGEAAKHRRPSTCCAWGGPEFAVCGPYIYMLVYCACLLGLLQ